MRQISFLEVFAFFLLSYSIYAFSLPNREKGFLYTEKISEYSAPKERSGHETVRVELIDGTISILYLPILNANLTTRQKFHKAAAFTGYVESFKVKMDGDTVVSATEYQTPTGLAFGDVLQAIRIYWCVGLIIGIRLKRREGEIRLKDLLSLFIDAFGIPIASILTLKLGEILLAGPIPPPNSRMKLTQKLNQNGY